MVCPKLIMGEGVALVILLSLRFNFSMLPWGSFLPSLYLVVGKDLERNGGSVGGQTLLPPGRAWRQNIGL